MLLQMGIPGGPELLILGLVALVLFGGGAALLLAVGVFGMRLRDDDRVENLERRLNELESELNASDDDDR